MAAEVVGTAFVRIKAITQGLGKDIKSGVEKGVKDAGLDKVGEQGGEDFNKGFDKSTRKGGRESGSNLGDEFLASFKDKLGRSDFKGLNELISKKTTENFRTNFEESIQTELDRGNLDKIGVLIRRRMKIDEEGGEESGSGFMRGLRRIFDRDGGAAGGDAGSSFFSGFADSFDGLGGKLKLGVIFSPAITGAASLLLQYVVSLVGQIGFLAEGMVGLGAAGGAAFGALALGALPLTLAFKAPTQALERFQGSLANVGHQWLEVGAATQQTLFYGLEYAANLSTSIIPAFRGFGREVGQIVSDFAEWQADFLFTQDGLARIREILQGSVPVIRDMVFAGGDLIDVFLDLFRSALPAAQLFAAALGEVTSRLQENVATAADNGSLADFFVEAYERGRLLVGALADVFVAIKNILAVGADSSTSFFTTFREWAREFRAFTESESGQNRLAAIFEQANAVAHEFNGLISDIFKAIGRNVFDAGGADGIIGFIRVLREDVVPFLESFITKLSSGGYGDALVNLAEAFGNLISKLDSGGALAPAISTLAVALNLLATSFDLLLSIPGMDKLVGILLGLGTALGALKLLGIGKLAAQLVSLGGSLAGVEKGTKTFATLQGIFSSGGFAAIGANLARAGAAISTFAASLGSALVAAAPFILAAAAIAGAAYLIYRNWGTIKTFFGGIFDFLKRNWQTVVAVVLSVIAPFIGLPLLIIQNWTKVVGFFKTIGNAIVGALKALPGLLVQAFKIALEAVRLAVIIWLRTLVVLFIGIPVILAQALVSLGVFLVRAFVAAFTALLTWIPTAIAAVVNFFTALPGQIINAISVLVGMLVAFFSALPGQILAALAALGSTLLGIFTSALDTVMATVTGWIASLLGFLTALPGQVVDALTALPGVLLGVFTSALDSVQNFVSGAIDRVLKFFRDAPGNVRELLGGLADAIKAPFKAGLDAIKKFWNDTVGGFGFSVPSWVPFAGGKSFHIPEMAFGGIVKAPITALIGEAGAEAVLPLTRPNVMRSILTNNPEVAAAIQAAMPPQLLRLRSDVVSSIASLRSGVTTSVSDSGVTIDIGSGAIVVQFTGPAADTDYQRAGEEVMRGLARAAAERKTLVQIRALGQTTNTGGR